MHLLLIIYIGIYRLSGKTCQGFGIHILLNIQKLPHRLFQKRYVERF